MHARRAGGEGRPSELGCLVRGQGDRGHAARRRGAQHLERIVGTCGRIDDDAVDIGQSRRDRGGRSNGHGLCTRPAQAVCQPGRPDQVVRDDRDPRPPVTGGAAHPRSETMWRKTSAAVRTPVGRSPSTIGRCRNPPTAILLMATATVSS